MYRARYKRLTNGIYNILLIVLRNAARSLILTLLAIDHPGSLLRSPPLAVVAPPASRALTPLAVKGIRSRCLRMMGRLRFLMMMPRTVLAIARAAPPVPTGPVQPVLRATLPRPNLQAVPVNHSHTTTSRPGQMRATRLDPGALRTILTRLAATATAPI